MTRLELIKSTGYRFAMIQICIIDMLSKKIKEKGIDNLPVKYKSEYKTILRGEYDGRISELTDLCVSIGFAPIIDFIPLDKDPNETTTTHSNI